MPEPPPRLGSTTRLPGANRTCCPAMDTPLAHAVGESSFCYRQSLAAPTRSVATTAGPSKTIFFSTAAPANDSSELACRRDRKLESSTHSSPHAHSKSQISQRSGAGGDGTVRVVECLSGGVETLRSIAHIPFGPSACPPLCCIFLGHARIPHASRQPCLYHAVGRSCDHIQIGQSARHLPTFALLSMLVSPQHYC